MNEEQIFMTFKYMCNDYVKESDTYEPNEYREDILRQVIHDAYEAGKEAQNKGWHDHTERLVAANREQARRSEAESIFRELDKISLGNNFDDFSEQGLKKNISDDLVLDDLKTYQALKSRHLKDSDKKD